MKIRVAEAETTFEVTERKVKTKVGESESKRKLLTFTILCIKYMTKTHFNIENMIYELSHELQQTRSTKYSKLCVCSIPHMLDFRHAL